MHPAPPPPAQAFVLFESAEEARRATQKDRETFSVDKFGERYVRVYPSLESDAADISQAVLQQNMTHPQVRRGGARTTLRFGSMAFSFSPALTAPRAATRMHAHGSGKFYPCGIPPKKRARAETHAQSRVCIPPKAELQASGQPTFRHFRPYASMKRLCMTYWLPPGRVGVSTCSKSAYCS
jgi:hypothetical protein